MDYEYVITSFKSGNENAFKSLFNLLYMPLCIYGKRIVVEFTAVEEIVDDCFVRVWNKRTQFNDYRSLKAYLYVSVRNGCLTWLSLQKSEPLTKLNLEHKADVAGFEPDDATSIEAEFIKLLPNILSTLTVQQQNIIQKSFFEGKKTRAIANELDVSESTVKTQKARTLIKIKKALRKGGHSS